MEEKIKVSDVFDIKAHRKMMSRIMFRIRIYQVFNYLTISVFESLLLESFSKYQKKEIGKMYNN